MTSGQVIRYEMLLRVSKFGETHRDLFPPDSVGGQAFADIATAVGQLSAHAVSKMSSQKEGLSSKSIGRSALLRRLTAVARSARVIARTKAGFDAQFRLPDSRSDQALLTAGRLFIQEAGRSKDLFVEYGMPADFIAGLSTLVEQFDEALSSRQIGLDGTTRARAGLDTTLATAIAAVRKLDIIVGNRLDDDPVTLAVWQRDRKVDYARRTRRPTIGTEPDPEARPAETVREVSG